MRSQNGSVVRLISAVAVVSLVLAPCSAQRNRLEIVRSLENQHLGIATFEMPPGSAARPFFRVRWVSSTGELSWGPTLEGMQAHRVRTSQHGDKFVVWYVTTISGEDGLLIADLTCKELWRMPY